MRKILLVLLFGLFLINPIPSVQAHGESEHTDIEAIREAQEAKIEERRKKKEAKALERCDKVRARLQANLDRADLIKDHRSERYQNIVDKLNNLADRVEEAGLDATNLRSLITELEAKITSFRSAFADYEGGLGVAITAVCGDQAELHNYIDEAKTERANLKQLAADIRTYIHDTIKPELESLKSQLEATDSDG